MAKALGLLGPVASGSHILGLFSALAPTRLRAYGRVLGPEIDARFGNAILADTDYLMRWVLENRCAKRAPGAFDLRFPGVIVNQVTCDIAVQAIARLVLSAKADG